jgi:hypothetical protein
LWLIRAKGIFSPLIGMNSKKKAGYVRRFFVVCYCFFMEVFMKECDSIIGLSWLGIDVFDAFASIKVSGVKRPSR